MARSADLYVLESCGGHVDVVVGTIFSRTKYCCADFDGSASAELGKEPLSHQLREGYEATSKDGAKASARKAC